ncbi:hypothetical protein YSY43_07320 [Paenibacillus sp. YSY-4.3]
MKTPVIIISGFLGSGKTTLLLELIKALHGRKIRPAILMNELGKADVDGLILTEAVKGLQLEKLFDGCICCSKKSEISGSITSLLALAPDVILVELTGVANPEEVVDAMAEPELLGKVALHKIITVVDAENALEYNSIFSSDKQLVHTLRRQLAVADVILVNKQDLVPDSHLSKVQRLIKKHNEQAVVFNTAFGNFNPESVIHGLGSLNLQAKAPSPFKLVRQHHYHDDASASFGGQDYASFSRIQSIYIPINRQDQLSLKKMEKFLKDKDKRVLRAKGYIPLEDPSYASLIQFSGKQIRMESAGYKGPHYMIIIGYELDENALLEQWHASVLK